MIRGLKPVPNKGWLRAWHAASAPLCERKGRASRLARCLDRLPVQPLTGVDDVTQAREGWKVHPEHERVLVDRSFDQLALRFPESIEVVHVRQIREPFPVLDVQGMKDRVRDIDHRFAA